ncbi:MAG: tryptophan--tRNA ligase [Patescibacteria group bacterium]|jgi:tryptophanyl-tRNA synthetase|nr:tryptophan--tRNA ligase [Patescibacteria group bacterium]
MSQLIFSGIQPSGQIHLGNYLGAIQNWVQLQKEYQCIYSIVDLHAMTVDYDAKNFQQRILETAATLLACGIDPKKSIFFVQSHVPQHTELTWIFNTLLPISELERMTQFKDKAQQHKNNINAGLFTYPILQSADILLYKADAVPVGEDQVQHIELTRKIAKKFNNKFGDYFPEPKELITQAPRIMSLTDPTQKMSKSHGEKTYIALTDEPEIIRKKIMSAVTDTGDSKTMSPGVINLFTLLKIVADKKTADKFEQEYKTNKIKYSELKTVLADNVVDLLKPIQKQYQTLIQKPDQVWKTLDQGAQQAEKIASKNMTEIKKLTGLIK